MARTEKARLGCLGVVADEPMWKVMKGASGMGHQLQDLDVGGCVWLAGRVKALSAWRVRSRMRRGCCRYT